MIDKIIIADLLTDFLEDKDFFFVKISISKDNVISIFLDGPKGILIDDCIQVSRHIESQLDREKEDFELEVSSFGIGNPLLDYRQYIINVGRTAKITLNDNSTVDGIITDADEKSFKIEISTKEKNKKIRKEILTLKYDECRETKIIASFK